MFAVMNFIVRGIITEFAGAIANIPAGWVLCDGTNGTPNLRDAFIVGAGTSYAVDASGGTENHTHVVNQTAHAHELEPGPDINMGEDYSEITLTEDPAISCTTVDNLPPYYALAFIMKL